MGSATAALPELPSFKGVPGWEFTDLSKLHIDSYAPAPPSGEELLARLR